MIQLTFEDLLQDSSDYLRQIQNRITSELNYNAKVERARIEWESKENTKSGKKVFEDVKSRLVNMCSGVRICVYCEHNEATDLEHIYPKRLFPDKAFIWDNYLLVCNRCNSHFKKDKFKIFYPANSISIVDVTPVRNIYLMPQSDDALFINQRTENPMDFLELDFVQRTFLFIERPNPGTREYEKAKFTKDALGLNTRADLVEQRKAAFVYFKNELSKYVLVSQSRSMQELKNFIDGVSDKVDTYASFDKEKERIKEAIKQRIAKHNHTTVWKEIIRQRAYLPTTLPLFTQAPEALSWNVIEPTGND